MYYYSDVRVITRSVNYARTCDVLINNMKIIIIIITH